MCQCVKPKYEIGDLLETIDQRFGIVTQIDIRYTEHFQGLKCTSIDYRLKSGSNSGLSYSDENCIKRRVERAIKN